METRGEHVIPWNELRTYGPLGGRRWEPHPFNQATIHPDNGVSYQATDLATCLAEVFQTTRRIDPFTGAPQAVFWTPRRTLSLLDLTGTWSLRMGVSSALMAASRPTCCAWARAIRRDLPNLDGLRATSTMTGRDVIVLFAPAHDAFLDLPDAVLRLDSDLGAVTLTEIARLIGYRFG